MSETVLHQVRGAHFVSNLPTPGPWFLASTTINGTETLIACAPDHPPIFYRDGKEVDLFGGGR